jgi:chromosome segregation ATPase
MVEVVSLLEERVVRLIEEIEALRTKKNQLEAENDGLKITVADYERTKSELEAAQARMAELEAASGDAEAAQAMAAEQEARANDLQARLDSQAGAAQAQAAELEAARARIAQLEEWHDGVCKGRDEAQGELDVARELLAVADAEKAELVAERDALKAHAQELESRANSHGETEKELEALRGMKAEMEEQLAAAQRRDLETRGRLNGLIERIENAEQALLNVELIHEPA